MQKLRQKYKGAENRQILNQEMMKLYKDNNVSPTGGCLPMFLQMPALVVLYDVIKGLANTVTKGQKLATGKICHITTCATPRYIPHASKMYDHLVQTPGVMKAFGMNLAAKPLSHHTHVIDYIPYIALVLVAVGLQYFQMAQMTRRNKKSGVEAPQQMQQMQKIMPIIFAYIYFLVPAGVVIYMIVSSAIRVLTQDIIFRFGIVPATGAREIGGAKKDNAKGVTPKGSGAPKSEASAAPKAHPRAKNKRSRKDR
jgi:YidC/Oxa1 family membrane protein insertase